MQWYDYHPISNTRKHFNPKLSVCSFPFSYAPFNFDERLTLKSKSYLLIKQSHSLPWLVTSCHPWAGSLTKLHSSGQPSQLTLSNKHNNSSNKRRDSLPLILLSLSLTSPLYLRLSAIPLLPSPSIPLFLSLSLILTFSFIHSVPSSLFPSLPLHLSLSLSLSLSLAIYINSFILSLFPLKKASFNNVSSFTNMRLGPTWYQWLLYGEILKP